MIVPNHNHDAPVVVLQPKSSGRSTGGGLLTGARLVAPRHAAAHAVCPCCQCRIKPGDRIFDVERWPLKVVVCSTCTGRP